MNNVFKLLIAFFVLIQYSYAQNSNNETTILPKGYEELLVKIDTLEKSMIQYMKSSKPSYSESEVNNCIKILRTYTQKIAKTSSKEEGMELVKVTIIELNKLNQKCENQLIETGEREQIAQIIIQGSSKKGYNTINEDITESWREW